MHVSRWVVWGAVLAALGPASTAAAYERDVHLAVTFAIAFADSWGWDDARLIAAADQAMDDNDSTVATADLNPDGQNPPNWLEDHCISRTNDDDRANGYDPEHPYDPRADPGDAGHPFDGDRPESDPRADDVRDVLKRRQAQVEEGIESYQRGDSGAAGYARILVLAGLFFHCQEDSWSHNGYGGRDQGHASAGHAPDRPATQERTGPALQEKAVLLDHWMFQLTGNRTLVNASDIGKLVDAVTDPQIDDDLDDHPAFGDHEEQRLATEAIVSHWLHWVLERHGKLDKCQHPCAITGDLYARYHLRRHSTSAGDGSYTEEGEVVRDVLGRHFGGEPAADRGKGIQFPRDWGIPELQDGKNPKEIRVDGTPKPLSTVPTSTYTLACTVDHACVFTSLTHPPSEFGSWSCPGPPTLVEHPKSLGAAGLADLLLDRPCRNAETLVGPWKVAAVTATPPDGGPTPRTVFLSIDRNNNHVFGEPGESEFVLRCAPEALVGAAFDLGVWPAHVVVGADAPVAISIQIEPLEESAGELDVVCGDGGATPPSAKVAPGLEGTGSLAALVAGVLLRARWGPAARRPGRGP